MLCTLLAAGQVRQQHRRGGRREIGSPGQGSVGSHARARPPARGCPQDQRRVQRTSGWSRPVALLPGGQPGAQSRPRARSGPEPAVHRQRLYASHLGKVQPRIGAHDRATRRSRPCPHGCASTRAACRPRAHYRRPLAGNCGVNCGGSASHTYLVLCAAADYTAARAAGPGPRGTRQRRKERNPGSAGCSRTGCFLYSAVPRWRCWRRCVTPAPVTWARDGTDTHTYTRTHTHTQQNDKNNQRVVE